jgi:hypothetical protein
MKLEAPLQMAKSINCPYYFVLAKAEVNPDKPGNRKYFVHIVFETSSEFD